MPGQAKIVSMMTEPLMKKMSCSEKSESTGRKAFLNACFQMITRSGSPFARAVRT